MILSDDCQPFVVTGPGHLSQGLDLGTLMSLCQAKGKEKKERGFQLTLVKEKGCCMDTFGTSGTITPLSLSLHMNTPKCLE